MIFNSVSFLLFLVLVIPFYWFFPRTPRLWLIFISSLTFYGFWRIEFIPLMLFSTLVDYIVAQSIDKVVLLSRKRFLLAVSICINLGLLFYFKYLFFFVNNVADVLLIFGLQINKPVLDIILPLGISFYTFQTISYTVDVYRGFIRPEKNFVLYACYVTFFPQLIAGPILRAKEVIHQFMRRPNFNLVDFGNGLRWIFYGLFLKVVLADNIAPLVDDGFTQPVSMLSALDVWTLAFMFGFQIYFDFSAYSHIAIGSARMMGIHFPDNFFYPYLACSPKEFWRRWHISLSSWIRDYLYLPLSGVKVQDRSTGGLAIAIGKEKSNPKRSFILVLFLTWAIMGLWHGANWTFIIWGIYHAIFIYLYRILAPLVRGWTGGWLHKFIGWSITLPVVMLSWIPFRAESINNTFDMWEKVFLWHEYTWLGMRENVYLVAAVVLISVIAIYFVRKWYSQMINSGSPFIMLFQLISESAVFVIIIGLVFVFLRPIQQFIYFQF
jgi:alginate O-acetyltransferase complex protein AlgI